MGKRKTSKEEVSSDSGDEAPVVKAKTAKKPKIQKDSDDETDTRAVEKPASTSGSSVIVRRNAEGDQYIELGKKKRATVRSYQKAIFVDIREFYEKDGEEKPGKKGISLSREQWTVLKNNATTIDALFEQCN